MQTPTNEQAQPPLPEGEARAEQNLAILKGFVDQWGDQLRSRFASMGLYDNIGRNAPCPCGSGKKYKKCCGK